MASDSKPELSLIKQLQEAREALMAERQSLMARVHAIDEALGLDLVGVPKKPKPKEQKGSKSGGLKESVIVAVTGTQGLTIKEIQTLVCEGSPKSVEATVHGLAAEGRLTKDQSTPRKFSLPAQAKVSGAPKTNGATA